MSQVAQVGDFCPYTDCPDDGKPPCAKQTNREKYGLPHAGYQRYRCNACGRTFVETPGHALLPTAPVGGRPPGNAGADRRREPRQQYRTRQRAQRGHHLGVVARSGAPCRGDRRCLAGPVYTQTRAVGRYGGLHQTHARKTGAGLGDGGDIWRATMIDKDTRLRLACGIASTETAAHGEVFATLKQCGPPDAPPPTVADGWGGVDEAMGHVYGQVPPDRGRGRPPTQKPPQADWHYLPVMKQRDAHGRLLGIHVQGWRGSAGARRLSNART
jgi:hypothetical protein